jgi:hypothetical protein
MSIQPFFVLVFATAFTNDLQNHCCSRWNRVFDNKVASVGVRAHGALMTNDLKLQKEQLDQIRRERTQLAEQIRMSQQTIERSQQLIRQMDEILAKAEQDL